MKQQQKKIHAHYELSGLQHMRQTSAKKMEVFKKKKTRLMSDLLLSSVTQTLRKTPLKARCMLHSRRFESNHLYVKRSHFK